MPFNIGCGAQADIDTNPPTLVACSVGSAGTINDLTVSLEIDDPAGFPYVSDLEIILINDSTGISVVLYTGSQAATPEAYMDATFDDAAAAAAPISGDVVGTYLPVTLPPSLVQPGTRASRVVVRISWAEVPRSPPLLTPSPTSSSISPPQMRSGASTADPTISRTISSAGTTPLSSSSATIVRARLSSQPTAWVRWPRSGTAFPLCSDSSSRRTRKHRSRFVRS